MSSIDRTVTTTAPLAAVWDFLTDFSTTEQWDPPTVSTERVSGDGGVGTVYRNVSHGGGQDVEVTYTVTEVDPQQRFRLSGVSDHFEVHDTITFDDLGPAGTRVQYVAEFELTGAAKLATPVLPLGLSRLGDKAEESLQEHLDALGPSSPR